MKKKKGSHILEEEEISRRDFIKVSAYGLSGASLYMLAQTKGDQKFRSKTQSARPNIITLVTDDQRWDAIGCAGNTIIQTPNMDLLAQNGAHFKNAFVTTPICAASRASIFTGLYERTHGYTFTKPPLSKTHIDISYPYLLRQAGYRTGLVGKFGIKVKEGLEKEKFDFFKPARLPYFHKVNGKRKHLTDINTDRAIEFLHSCKRTQPFCLSLSFWAPHAVDGDPKQYFWPASCDHLYQNVTIPPPKTSDPEFFEAQPEFLRNSLNRERWYWRFDTPEKYQKMVKGYYRMISGVDMALGRLIEELRKLNMDQNTVFILMGDNGYFLGERGYAGKWTMHETSIRVPLIIYDPRRESSQRGLELSEMVLNVDITPTILDLAGISVPKMIQGNSLLPILEGKSTKWRSEVFCEHLWDHPKIPQTEAVRTTHWKYIRYPQHPEFEELYDLSHDPREENNLINKKHYAKQWIKLRTRCDRMIEVLTK